MKHKPNHNIFKSVRTWRDANQYYTQYKLRNAEVLVVTLKSNRVDMKEIRV